MFKNYFRRTTIIAVALAATAAFNQVEAKQKSPEETPKEFVQKVLKEIDNGEVVDLRCVRNNIAITLKGGQQGDHNFIIAGDDLGADGVTGFINALHSNHSDGSFRILDVDLEKASDAWKVIKGDIPADRKQSFIKVFDLMNERFGLDVPTSKPVRVNAKCAPVKEKLIAH
jgi:hypothetical protein